MAKKTEGIKKISVNKLKESVKNQSEFYGFTVQDLVGVEGVSLYIKYNLEFEEFLEFVNEVVESCIDLDSLSYIPEAVDFYTRIAVLTKYANLTMPQNINEQYHMIYNSCIYDTVVASINKAQFSALTTAISEKIEFNKQAMISSGAIKMQELIEAFSKLYEGLSSAMEDIDDETFSNIEQMSKNLTEKNVAEGVLSKMFEE